MESDDDVPLILTWDEANSGLLNDEAERGDESKIITYIIFSPPCSASLSKQCRQTFGACPGPVYILLFA